MRRSDSHLDFDLEVAKKQSNENPVYYVQYAYARICSILRMAEERGIALPAFRDIEPGSFAGAGGDKIDENHGPLSGNNRRRGQGLWNRIALLFYLNDLASLFHSYYNKNKVISDNEKLTAARLFLMQTIRIVLQNALNILGVSAPEKM